MPLGSRSRRETFWWKFFLTKPLLINGNAPYCWVRMASKSKTFRWTQVTGKELIGPQYINEMSLVGRGPLNNWWMGPFSVCCSSGWHCSLWAMIHSLLWNKLFQVWLHFPCLFFFFLIKSMHLWNSNAHNCVQNINEKLIHILRPTKDKPQRTLPGGSALGKTSFLREEERYGCVKFLLDAKISRAGWIDMRPSSPIQLVICWVWQRDNWYLNCMPPIFYIVHLEANSVCLVPISQVCLNA